MTEPFPGATAKVTAAPVTGLPAASCTSTEGGEATAVPAVPDCVIGLVLVIVAAVPAPSVIAAVAEVRAGAAKLNV